ncbi:GNAT family N-acetyltransferase [Kitasatospora sp. NPDC052896]|uniref:GNAT family N-acetyltransferase n=1 Tax=Kitasatospora sp. NPDC052896 TaxID=3364061 RepID=UPI0037C5F52B
MSSRRPDGKLVAVTATDFELRALAPDDWPDWRELRLAALAEAPYAFGSTLAQWQGEGDQAGRWRARLEIPGSHNLIALLDGRPVGMASGVPGERPGAVELISFWVSPSGRGRAVGDRLIGEVERWAVERGAEVLVLAVKADNTHAVALYERNGFVDVGPSEDAVAEGELPERLMSKRLLQRY